MQTLTRVLGATMLLGLGVAAQEQLLVVLKSADALGIYDATTGKEEARVAVGRKPHEFALTADGATALVTNYGVDTWNTTVPGENTITIVDVKARKVMGEIGLGEFRRPHGIERGASGKFYVTTDLPAALLVVDAKKRKVMTAIRLTSKLPHMVCVAPDERKAWTADAGSGTVTVVDLANKREFKTFQVGGVPMGVALSPDGKRLFATTQSGNEIVWIDAVANAVRRRLAVPGGPARLLFSSDGVRLFTSLFTSGEVAVIDPKAFLEVKRFEVGKSVEGMAFDEGERHFYVSAQGEDHVFKYSMPGLEPALTIEAKGKPDPVRILAR